MKKIAAIFMVMLLLFSCASAATYAKVRNSTPITVKIIGQGTSPVCWYKQENGAWKVVSNSAAVTIPRTGIYRVVVQDFDIVGHYSVAPLQEIKVKPAVRIRSVRRIKE